MTMRKVSTCGLIAVLSCAGSLSAQADDSPTLRLRGVELRQPEAMNEHPLELIGIEQAGNDFRSRTPALEQAVQRTAKVPTEELRQRRLALYNGAQPLRGETARVRASSAPRFADPMPNEGPGVGLGVALMLFTAAVAFGALMAWRFFSQWSMGEVEGRRA